MALHSLGHARSDSQPTPGEELSAHMLIAGLKSTFLLFDFGPSGRNQLDYRPGTTKPPIPMRDLANQGAVNLLQHLRDRSIRENVAWLPKRWKNDGAVAETMQPHQCSW